MLRAKAAQTILFDRESTLERSEQGCLVHRDDSNASLKLANFYFGASQFQIDQMLAHGGFAVDNSTAVTFVPLYCLVSRG